MSMNRRRGAPLAEISETDPLAIAYNRGLEAEKAGDLDAASAAFNEVLRLDPADHGGVAVRLAAMGKGADPDKAPDAYVATLFDQHAETFDSILVDQLAYRVPWLVEEALSAYGLGPFARALDLGCGTGLTGLALGDRVQELVGVDLAEQMLAESDERDCYDQLFVGEAVQFLSEEDTRFDLIAATDVLPYIGDLAPLLAALTPCLSPGGVIALSSETLAKDPFGSNGWRIGARHRFAHSEAYLRGLILAADFEILTFEPITVRLEDGAPVPGHLIVARL